jgi:putative oxygen-independent coproporphyrinogen III oxidase
MNSIGVYIQVPFCASKCTFCNFSSRVERSEAFADYARVVCREIELVPEIARRRGVDPSLTSAPVDTIYIGGGTPSLIGAELLGEIIASLRRRFKLADSVEFTFETTPGSTDDAFMRQACALGINRLGIGAQSFDDRELSAVGRLHSSEDTRTLVESARRQGFRNISLDLIAGLPHQTAASWQASLRAALSLGPEHVSIYLFEIDEKSRLGKEVLEHGTRYHASDVPNEAFMVEAYEMARRGLHEAGFVQYEISNFAKPAFESRHNLKYWRLEPYIGIGAGAHSFDGFHRWANTNSVDKYCARIGQGDSAIDCFQSMTTVEQLEEFFFLGLRQKEGIDLDFARRRWGSECVMRWNPTIWNLARSGWLELRGERLSMTDRAYLVSNEVFQEFLVD